MDDELAERPRQRAATYGRPVRGTTARRRPQTAEYLRRVQYDTASLIGATDDPNTLDNAGPAYLRSRAAHYRGLAAQQTDAKHRRLFLDLAASFEKHAVTKERRSP
jgi:hypothetical protein